MLWYVTWRNKEYLWFLESDYKSLFVITSVCLDMNTSEWLNFRIDSEFWIWNILQKL